MEAGAHVQKKIKTCLKCEKVIEEGWLCIKCRMENKLIEETHFYTVLYPWERYWVYQS